MNNVLPFIIWLLFSIGLGAYLSASVPSGGEEEDIATSKIYLPGETTHGHYQIELKCDACHTPFKGVTDDACMKCHEQELREARDTHPKSKFSDPSKANLLEHIDARSCIACHREHVPHETREMGLTIPDDYCFHCHETVGEDRPSHKGMTHDTCATAGCHNYHDNRALYESFLDKHFGEPNFLDTPRVPTRIPKKVDPKKRLTLAQANSPEDLKTNRKILSDWEETAHAISGVNCKDCHNISKEGSNETVWSDKLTHEACQKCHENETDGFLTGKHGMRVASGLSPMKPKYARLKMHSDVLHQSLSCSSCHTSHRFDRQEAAVESCLKCHNDEHSNSYKNSVHYDLWKREVNGEMPVGSGVSCATCHLPRIAKGDDFQVQHNQNWNLQPNETMGRSVCMNCHGLEYSLSALADKELIKNNFQGEPQEINKSVKMAHDWMQKQKRLREERKKRRQNKK